ncbi:MAG: DNA polymerase IV [Burkholderiales bacterium]|nr:DNA polymerase IV [Burkholderiales bacterium]
MERRIAHLDMDAFYASVELLRYPQLRGLPLVIGGRRRQQDDDASAFARLRDYVGRGVATTATYEARAFGVHSGMGLMKAAKLAPDAILLPADFDEYRRYSRLFKAAVAAIAPRIEDRGIDEIYIDLTGVPGESLELAQRIKDNVRQATGLTCSIGITPNKLLSKIASELDKPDGITVLRESEVATRIWPLPVRRINGIGPRSGSRLEEMGIGSIGALARTPLEHLREQFGERQSRWLLDAANGRDDRPVVTVREPKSISRETTFERDLDAVRDRRELTRLLVDLCDRISGDLRRSGYVGRTIGVKLRYDDFRIVTRDATIGHATDDPAVILAAVRGCLRRVPFDRRLRLLGVRVGTLARQVEAGPPSPALAQPPMRGLFEGPAG